MKVLNDILTDDEHLDPIRSMAFSSAMVDDVKDLVSVGNDAKTVKSLKELNVLTGIVYMAPADSSGFNVCPSMTKGCKEACLFTAGCGRYPNVKAGRMRRTYQFLLRQDEFMAQLVKEIEALIRKATKLGAIPAVRLNGTSDIAWEDIPVDGHKNIFRRFPDLAFYDYTKRYDRLAFCAAIPNYRLTFSRAETKLSNSQAIDALQDGYPVTVVFSGDLPSVWHGFRVIDGDKHDFRFWDAGVVVGLKIKGDNKTKQLAIDSGFAVP